MKKLLRKLHLVPNQPDLADGSSSSSKGPRVALADCPTTPSAAKARKASPSQPLLEQKPLSSLAGWLSAITSKHGHGPQSPPSVEVCDGREVERRDSGSTNSRDPELEEEYQIQLALELSAREDPEAVQIEAVKQISLGSCPPQNNPAEVWFGVWSATCDGWLVWYGNSFLGSTFMYLLCGSGTLNING